MISRRWIVAAAATAAGGASAVAAAKVARRYGLMPPDSGGIYGPGEVLTYAAQRVLTSRHSMAREFSRSEISKIAPVTGEPPETESYRRVLAAGFQPWRLTIDGLVARPESLSLEDLIRLPATTQITHQACEEGWSFIAEWAGVSLPFLLERVGVLPAAKYIVFFPFDQSWDSLDLADAWHPQTLLAYGMNGEQLPTRHGAPLRLRVPRQIGYKSVKYLYRIFATDTLNNIGKGLGSFSPEIGYTWYAGI